MASFYIFPTSSYIIHNGFHPGIYCCYISSSGQFIPRGPITHRVRENGFLIYLTHRDLNKMAAILYPTFSHLFCWKKRFVLWLKFHGFLQGWNRCYVGNGSDDGFTASAIRRHAIAWTHTDQVLWCHMASLRLNQLTAGQSWINYRYSIWDNLTPPAKYVSMNWFTKESHNGLFPIRQLINTSTNTDCYWITFMWKFSQSLV